MLVVAEEYSCTHEERTQAGQDGGYHCAVLNMASSTKPGGGVRGGKGRRKRTCTGARTRSGSWSG
eukprot:2591116-Alexandrium_andersonii.AAC.1